MILKPLKLGAESLPEDIIEQDKKTCKRFGPCGVGEKALFLNSFYVDRRYYVPISSVTRIFKRVAMSKGGFTGKGAFGTLPYLVVEYDNGNEKQCNFKHEEDVDRLLAFIASKYPELPLHSREAERKLAEKAKRLSEKKYVKELSDTAQKNLQVLEQAEKFLNMKSNLYMELSISAKKKRVYDRSNPSYKWVALAIILMGIAAFAYGVYALITHAGLGMYFLLFGLAAVFMFSGANVLPTSKNNRKYIEKQLADSIQSMEQYIHKYPEFPIPAYYAHPNVLNRMQEIIKEGRAEELSAALDILKEDLKALNSSVVVEQEEYDEIIAIKPMFLVMDYK